MRKRFILSVTFLSLIVIGLPKISFALDCLPVTCTAIPLIKVSGLYCATSTTSCYNSNDIGVVSCTSCPEGYFLIQATDEISPDGLSGGTCTVKYNTCVEEATVTPGCNGKCVDCESTDWKSYRPNDELMVTGYEYKINAICNYFTCECTKTTAYRCASGYYGRSLNGTSGCSRCPSPTDGFFFGGDSEAGNNSFITQCYVSSGSDSSGSYIYKENCYYTN